MREMLSSLYKTVFNYIIDALFLKKVINYYFMRIHCKTKQIQCIPYKQINFQLQMSVLI